jgi:hypothetical protein
MSQVKKPDQNLPVLPKYAEYAKSQVDSFQVRRWSRGRWLSFRARASFASNENGLTNGPRADEIGGRVYWIWDRGHEFAPPFSGNTTHTLAPNYLNWFRRRRRAVEYGRYERLLPATIAGVCNIRTFRQRVQLPAVPSSRGSTRSWFLLSAAGFPTLISCCLF